MSRILLYGPPLAGKSTILAAVARASALPVESFFVSASRDPQHPCRGTRPVIQDPVRRWELRTLSGPTQTDDMWADLLRDAAAVVLVLDGQGARIDANSRLDERTRFARWPRSFDGRRAIRALVDSL